MMYAGKHFCAKSIIYYSSVVFGAFALVLVDLGSNPLSCHNHMQISCLAISNISSIEDEIQNWVYSAMIKQNQKRWQESPGDIFGTKPEYF